MILAIAGPGATPYLLLSAALFSLGAAGLLVRRNALVMFMCVELMLNAVNLSFVTLARHRREAFIDQDLPHDELPEPDPSPAEEVAPSSSPPRWAPSPT